VLRSGPPTRDDGVPRPGDVETVTAQPLAAPAGIGIGIGIVELERVMAGHWQAPDREHLGGWLLRAAGGFTGRANSALTVGDPGMPVPQALAAVRAWYATRGLAPTASVVGPAGPALPDAAAHDPLGPALAADGWQVLAGAGALVLTAALDPLRDCGPEQPPGGLTLDLAATPDAGWLGTYRYRGQDLPPHAVEVLLSAPDQVFCSIRDGARTAAVARGSLAAGWVGVAAVEVAPAYRRRGLARVLLAAIARWGVAAAADRAYLQVGDGNAAALALYAAAGFAVHHRYDYLRAG
jgi:GNAT superfamily N-acetyltransferase